MIALKERAGQPTSGGCSQRRGGGTRHLDQGMTLKPRPDAGSRPGDAPGSPEALRSTGRRMLREGACPYLMTVMRAARPAYFATDAHAR